MRFPDRSPVSLAKLEALRSKIAKLGLDLERVDEQFIHGSGPGGQKINKTASCVALCYPPLSLAVKCQESRSQALNRYLALRRLVEKAEELLRPAEAPRIIKVIKRKKQKDRRRRRHARKTAQESLKEWRELAGGNGA